MTLTPLLPLVYHLDKKIDFNSLPTSVLHAFHPPPVPAYKSFFKCTRKGSKNWYELRLIKQFACRTSSKTWIRFFEVFFTFLKDPWNKIRFFSVVIFIRLAIFVSGWIAFDTPTSSCKRVEIILRHSWACVCKQAWIKHENVECLELSLIAWLTKQTLKLVKLPF